MPSRNIINGNGHHHHKKAWIVTVDMGYGHQRAADPLRDLAYKDKIINANNYVGIPKKDRDTWHQSREFYEFISRFKKIPIFGEKAFEIYDKLQKIPSFYPKRDLSAPTLPVKEMTKLIKKNNWGKHLVEKLSKTKKPIPIITTFFIPAFMAEIFNYPGDIYCLATDTDISRSWVAMNPNTSRIKYFAPSYRVEQRLKLYGIRERNIYHTGFPLPKENLGKDLRILKNDLSQRLINLDPKKRFIKEYEKVIKDNLGSSFKKTRKRMPVTITFAVGGAGAQRELALDIARSLKYNITKNKIKLILVAGTHKDIYKYFKKGMEEIGLGSQLGKNIKIVYCSDKVNYFRKFNQAIRQTDIIWTKPSELSFYTALGIPIVMSAPIGSQEDFNRKWLLTLGSGTDMEDPKYTDQWLADWIDSGWLAEAAWQGYLEAPKYGTYNIEKIIGHELEATKIIKTVLQY